jgi:hypothetical protein
MNFQAANEASELLLQEGVLLRHLVLADDLLLDVRHPGAERRHAPRQPLPGRGRLGAIQLAAAPTLLLGHGLGPPLRHVLLHGADAPGHHHRGRHGERVLVQAEALQPAEPAEAVRQRAYLVVAEVELAQPGQVADRGRQVAHVAEVAAQVQRLQRRQQTDGGRQAAELVEVRVEEPQRPHLADGRRQRPQLVEVHAQRLQVGQLVPDARGEVHQRVVARVQLHQRSGVPRGRSSSQLRVSACCTTYEDAGCLVSYLHFEMLSGRTFSRLPETSRILRLERRPMESGSETKSLEARRSSSRCSSPPIASGTTYEFQDDRPN